jgi:hypothetical protein
LFFLTHTFTPVGVVKYEGHLRYVGVVKYEGQGMTVLCLLFCLYSKFAINNAHSKSDNNDFVVVLLCLSTFIGNLNTHGKSDKYFLLSAANI